MKAMIVKIHNQNFLLPDGFDYVIPDFIDEHADLIAQYIDVANEILRELCNNPLAHIPNLTNKSKILQQELSEFKARTGIIGFPFDNRDVNLYVLDRKIDVVATLEL
ncbi:hypothetical protein [Erwinia mallotivora]|uniref:hypothetical protein n=1 Tax=Erwinia mallotivora TaxID=69222 RepID=UPI0021BF9F61|nr:hypothetical protein [Erwinia mallotivora]